MPTEVSTTITDFFAQYPAREFGKGEILIFAGEAPSGIFYLTAGSVRQYDVTSSGDEVVVNVFKPDAFFPMSYAMNRTPNDYFFAAAEPVEVRVAPIAATLDFVRGNPDVLFDLLARVYRGTDGLLRRQAYLMGAGAAERLLFELVTAARRFGKTQPDGSCLVNIKETELATRAGLTRETVNRQIHELKSRGFVHTSSDGLLIKDLDSLESKLHD